MKGICACEECDDGILVLDPASGPKHKISCNKYVSLRICFQALIILISI